MAPGGGVAVYEDSTLALPGLQGIGQHLRSMGRALLCCEGIAAYSGHCEAAEGLSAQQLRGPLPTEAGAPWHGPCQRCQRCQSQAPTWPIVPRKCLTGRPALVASTFYWAFWNLHTMLSVSMPGGHPLGGGGHALKHTPAQRSGVFLCHLHPRLKTNCASRNPAREYRRVSTRHESPRGRALCSGAFSFGDGFAMTCCQGVCPWPEFWRESGLVPFSPARIGPYAIGDA
jgi:hypothetical protein